MAFTSIASDLIPNDTNGSYGDIFLKDLTSGAIAVISTTADGTQGNYGGGNPVFSTDGTKVAFDSPSTNLSPNDAIFSSHVFVKDLRTEAITLISRAADGLRGNGWSYNPVFSPDGTKVAFWSDASNLVPGDTNSDVDIFIKDLASGAITRVSTAVDGTQGNARSYHPVFSPDGSKLAFWSDASNLVPGDTNGEADIFVVTLRDPLFDSADALLT